jgi:hypothetical protein
MTRAKFVVIRVHWWLELCVFGLDKLAAIFKTGLR